MKMKQYPYDFCVLLPQKRKGPPGPPGLPGDDGPVVGNLFNQKSPDYITICQNLIYSILIKTINKLEN